MKTKAQKKAVKAKRKVLKAAVVDAVFVIGTGSKNNNEELRYALRNLETNCPFIRNVYISGECPKWVDTSVVKHLKWPDRFTHAKDANIIDKLRHACETKGIAKNILFCSDDQFQTRVCTWDDFAPRWLRQYSETDRWYADKKRIWHDRLRKTLERDRLRRIESGLDPLNVYYYQPHIWMPIDRDKFIEYAKWSDYEHRDDTIIASGYFNYIDAKGKSNFDHVFISTDQKWPVAETHIAYSDPSFGSAMSYLVKTFDKKSKFELTDIEESKKKDTQDTPELSIISDFKSKIYAEPVWTPLISEIAYAENLRLTNKIGWRRVWNDILHRWAVDTERGKNHVPVTSTRSPAAEEIIKKYGDFRTQHVNGTPKKKTCSKCEERRKRLQEIQKHKATAAVAPVRKLVESTSAESADNSQYCSTCALEHLSTAIAHLGANLGMPEAVDIELAKGEVVVALQHLLDSEQAEAYNKCINVLASTYSEHSLLSVSSLRGIMHLLLDADAK